MLLTSIFLINHLLADFFFQKDKLLKNKENSIFLLFQHSLIYSVLFLPLIYILSNNFQIVVLWVVINCMLHFIVDSFFIEVNCYFLKIREQNLLVLSICFDQITHFVCLFFVYQFLFN